MEHQFATHLMRSRDFSLGVQLVTSFRLFLCNGRHADALSGTKRPVMHLNRTEEKGVRCI